MLTLNVLSPEISSWCLADGVGAPAGNSFFAFWRVEETTPGSKAASSLTTRLRGNQGDPQPARVVSAQFRTSLISEDGTGGMGKSGAPIVAMISGNAELAKGLRRPEIANEGNRSSRQCC